MRPFSVIALAVALTAGCAEPLEEDFREYCKNRGTCDVATLQCVSFGAPCHAARACCVEEGKGATLGCAPDPQTAQYVCQQFPSGCMPTGWMCTKSGGSTLPINCCSGVCGDDGKCGCSPPEFACQSASECCNNICTEGKCG